VKGGYDGWLRAKKWKEYKRFRSTFLLILLGGVPIFALGAVLAEKLFHTTAPVSVIAIVWFAAFLFNGPPPTLAVPHVVESGFLELGGTTKVFLPADSEDILSGMREIAARSSPVSAG
jgi:hypothetical protein